jgi:hypothetical protein
VSRLFVIIFGLFFFNSLFAKCSEVPETIRNSYANNFYHAFQLQCQGKSSSAFTQFSSAYNQALEAGEDIQRLVLIERLFVWYRTYGNASRLFANQPTGHDKIIGEYKRPSYPIFPKAVIGAYSYQSEWGRTPEEAALMRDFMLGVGEIISGTFCVAVGSVPAATIGGSLLWDGGSRVLGVVNQLWAQNERAFLDWKHCEESIKKLEHQR